MTIVMIVKVMTLGQLLRTSENTSIASIRVAASMLAEAWTTNEFVYETKYYSSPWLILALAEAIPAHLVRDSL